MLVFHLMLTASFAENTQKYRTDLPSKTSFLLMDVKYGSPPHLNCFLVRKFCYGPVDGSHPFHVRPPQNPQKLGVSDTMEAALDGVFQENAVSFVA